MCKRWLLVFGAVLVAGMLGCGSGEKVTKPDTIPEPPAGPGIPQSTSAAQPGEFGGAAKTP